MRKNIFSSINKNQSRLKIPNKNATHSKRRQKNLYRERKEKKGKKRAYIEALTRLAPVIEKMEETMKIDFKYDTTSTHIVKAEDYPVLEKYFETRIHV